MELQRETLQSKLFLSGLFLSIDLRIDTKNDRLKRNVFDLDRLKASERLISALTDRNGP